MKRGTQCFLFGLLMLFIFSFNVKADSLPEAVNGKITLDNNYTIDSVTFDSTSNINVLDLNGKTLTLNGTLNIDKAFEIKNGTIVRSTSHKTGPLLYISNKENNSVNLKNIVVDGNKVTTNAPSEYGEGYGIYVVSKSTTTIDNVKIKNNYTDNNTYASGLYIRSANKVIIKNSEIYDNKAKSASIGFGAAIYATYAKYVELKNTKIYNNYSAKGGNINVQFTEQFIIDKDTIIENNSATAAAGIRTIDTNMIISGTIKGNKTTSDNGAGIYTLFNENQYNNRLVKITKTAKILNNVSACAGGGLYVNSQKTNIPGKVIIEGATFSGNKALGTVDASAGLYKDIGGGAIAVSRGILEINDVKMSGNTASINKGNSIIVSHANGNLNGGKLTINGGSYDDSIDLGVGNIVVNGGTFKYDMSKYITNSELYSNKTSNGYEVIEKPVLLEGIIGKTDNKEVILNATDAIDLEFNDLNQKATYIIKLKNNSDNIVYVNDLITEGLSEKFIDFTLSEKSINAKIEPGKSKNIEVIVKTSDITHAGRNVNDELTLKILLENRIKNPATSNNLIIYIVLSIVLFIIFSIIYSKIDKKKHLTIMILLLLCSSFVVFANNDNTVEVKGKLKYTSQNLMQPSGITLNKYTADYTKYVDIWKYADKVKNIVISDIKIKPEEYEYRYDLSSNNSKRIYGYLVENKDKKTPYDLYIVASGVIYAPKDSTGLFSFPNVETIKGLEYIEFDNTTNMTAMFMGNEKLSSANVKDINTASATNTSYMFSGCDKLNVSEKDFNLEKVTNKNYMFNEKLSDVVKLNAQSDKNIDFSNISSATNGQGTYIRTGTEKDKNPVYYYRGAVTNNNILFGEHCWKMVRTTETGGVKLIYNGVPNNVINVSSAITGTQYLNVYNTSSSAFTFNSSSKKWTSTNKTDNSKNTISFNIAVAGNYVIGYTISSETNFDWAWFYKNGELLHKVSGTSTDLVNLGYVTSEDKIEVKYSKDGSVSKNNDNVVFYVVKGAETKPTCNNTGTASQIGTSNFNSERTSPTDIGYMYKERYPYKVVNIINTQKTEYIYGQDVEYKDGNYILKNTISGTNWTQDRTRIENKYRYTCLNSTGVCKNVNYITSNANDTYIYYQELSDGKKIDEYIDMIFPKNNITNEKDSTVKKLIDAWYENNLVPYSKYIEDAIWCNDRTIVSKGAWNPTFSTNANNDPLMFNGLKTTRLDSKCENKNDRFTVEEKNGNGNLKFPIGLLTSEEYNMAGAAHNVNNSNYYLYTGKWAWTLTPAKYTDIRARIYYIGSKGNITDGSVEDSSGAVRPSISLKNNTKIIYGNGTSTNPYIIK